MSFRVTPEFKALLDRCAEQSGRSLSQEIELRLEQSIRSSRVLDEALELAYGRQNAAFIVALAEIMTHASRLETALGKADWLADADEFKAVFKIIYTLFARAYPGKEPLSVDFTEVPDDYFTPLQVLTLAVVQKARDEPLPPWAEKVIEMGGPDLIARLTENVAQWRLAQPRED
jgi:hypothetical protein